jgi:FG-GAP-like repeat
VTVADFNRDAKPDVSVANGFTNDVGVLLERGSGSLFPAFGSPFATRGQQPIAVLAGDFNRDGKPDVAVANQVSNDVSILTGDGTGRLTPSAGSPFATVGISAQSIGAADFDRNGALDVAVATRAPTTSPSCSVTAMAASRRSPARRCPPAATRRSPSPPAISTTTRAPISSSRTSTTDPSQYSSTTSPRALRRDPARRRATSREPRIRRVPRPQMS